jgi:hypothetical protein
MTAPGTSVFFPILCVLEDGYPPSFALRTFHHFMRNHFGQVKDQAQNNDQEGKKIHRWQVLSLWPNKPAITYVMCIFILSG